MLPLSHSGGCWAESQPWKEHGADKDGLQDRTPPQVCISLSALIQGQVAPGEAWNIRTTVSSLLWIIVDNSYWVCSVCTEQHQSAQISFLREEFRLRGEHGESRLSTLPTSQEKCSGSLGSVGSYSIEIMCFSHVLTKRHDHQKDLQPGHLDTWFPWGLLMKGGWKNQHVAGTSGRHSRVLKRTACND